MNPGDLAENLGALASRLRGIAAAVDSAAAAIERDGNSLQTKTAMRGIVDELRDILQHAKSLNGLLYLLKRLR